MTISFLIFFLVKEFKQEDGKANCYVYFFHDLIFFQYEIFRNQIRWFTGDLKSGKVLVCGGFFTAGMGQGGSKGAANNVATQTTLYQRWERPLKKLIQFNLYTLNRCLYLYISYFYFRQK